MKQRTLRLASEEGQQLIMVALLMPILIACLGLVVDVGNVFVHQRMAQNAADAAASAAGMVLYPRGVSAAEARVQANETAHDYAARNRYDNNRVTNFVTTTVPTSGAYAGNTRYIQVTIQENVPPIFAGIVWNGTFTVRAWAVSGYTVTPLGADILVLKKDGCDSAALKMVGNKDGISTDGTVQVNSSCSNALDVQNGDITAGAINVHGSDYIHKKNGILSSTPAVNAPRVPDPLLGLATPSTAGCDTRLGSEDGKYLPGIYPLNFPFNFRNRFDGSGGECNGVFYFKGSLSAQGNDTIDINQGMFYFEMGSLTIKGSATMRGTAPTTGPYAGMLIFMARNNPGSVDLHGTTQANCSSAAANTKGIVYLPKGNLNLKGTADACFAGALIVGTIDQNGNTTTSLAAYSGTTPGVTITDSQVE